MKIFPLTMRRLSLAALAVTLSVGVLACPVAADGPAPRRAMSQMPTTVPAQIVLAADAMLPAVAVPDIQAAPYLLAPSDRLEISVRGHADLRQTVQVLADGTFNFPTVGRVPAAGKTVGALESYLEDGLRGIYRTPHVTVSVLESHARRISVAGAARTPGLYDYRPGLRLLEVVAACGGPVPDRGPLQNQADSRPAAADQLVQLTLVTDQGTRSIPVDLTALMRGDAGANLPLSPGDLLLFSPKDPATSMIQVIGEVQHPGQYPVMPGGATVEAVLTQAGGATDAAALSRVQVMHAGQVRNVNLHPLQSDLNDSAGRITLVAGDTLLVPPNQAKVAVLGEVKTPQVYLIPDGEAMPVTSALALAGGTLDDGDKKHVRIFRRGANGQTTTFDLDTEALLSGKRQSADVQLRPGDVLFVPTRRKGHGAGESSGVLYSLGTIFNLLK